LLALAQSEDVPVRFEDVDLATLLRRTARRWRAAAPRRRWAVECSEIWVRADPTRLEVAIDGVLENAVRHTADGGSVTLRGTVRGNEVLLEVEDDGHGISTSQLARVFECFHSAGPHAGTGLGLAIFRAVAEAHSGRVSAANAAAGGTVISLILPAY
jgi:signal transduction histidine kinase